MLALVALSVVAFLLALVLWRTFSTDSAQLPPVDVEAAVAEALNSLTPSPPVSVQVYQSILPSLVVVQTDEKAGVNRFGIGSGVVINSDANVLTALHVVEGAREIQLGFADGTKPKPRWDVHLRYVGDWAGILAEILRPLIAGWSCSAA